MKKLIKFVVIVVIVGAVALTYQNEIKEFVGSENLETVKSGVKKTVDVTEKVVKTAADTIKSEVEKGLENAEGNN